MAWAIGFRIRRYLRLRLWWFPVVGALAGPVLAWADLRLDERGVFPAAWRYGSSSAGTVLAVAAGGALVLTGFAVTVTLLAVQASMGPLSTSSLALRSGDGFLKAALAILVATITYSLTLLHNVRPGSAPTLGVPAAGLLLALGFILLVVSVDRGVQRLHPGVMAQQMADAARRVIATASGLNAAQDLTPVGPASETPAFVIRTKREGTIQAIDRRGLVNWARRNDCQIVMARGVGDSVPSDAPLMEIYGAFRPAPATRGHLRQMVVLGSERTIDQDPAFAIRVMVDVAIRALSPGVNDPTAAVAVIDHLEDLLHYIGSADLRALGQLRDRTGRVRLVLPSRTWVDYLTLAVAEIREYGSGAVQVLRRLRAMLEDLRDSVRPRYRGAVDDELSRLEVEVVQRFGTSVDMDQAGASDRQGIGGPHPARGPVRSWRGPM